MKHRWKTDNSGKVDNFAFDHANHNGPVCVACGKSFCEHCSPECYDADDCEPVNIDLALAQIAEMESKPLTWNERINQMTVEEKADWLAYELPIMIVTAEMQSRCEMYNYDCMRDALVGILSSPYTEGETK